MFKLQLAKQPTDINQLRQQILEDSKTDHYPLISFGYQTYYHDNIIKFHKMKNEFKNKIYRIINSVYYQIEDAEDSGNTGNTKNTKNAGNTGDAEEFQIKNKIKSRFNYTIKNQEDLKMCEIVLEFDLNPKTIKLPNLSETENSNVPKYDWLININKKSGKFADLYIFNKKLKYDNTRYQENKFNKFIPLILSDIDQLNPGSNCIIKMYSLFMKQSINFIHYLTTQFKEVYIYIPESMPKYQNTRYVIAKNKISQTEKITSPETKKSSFKNQIINFNQKIAVLQTETINQAISFINSQNYRGVVYQELHDKQINGSKKWIQKYIN